ncbi:hypothetical protein [Streptomyces sp. NPDC006463]|uniref:fascin domain-containing protein n=1 Tax=Streptomyces sp. NPDC006463 TaxID=3364746 RepID=UPI00369B4B0D
MLRQHHHQRSERQVHLRRTRVRRSALRRAASSHHGDPWKLFGLCRNRDTGETVLWSEANGDFVSAELGYDGSGYGELRARATEIGPWEKFFTPNTPGYGNTYFLSYANEGFVSAELGYTGDSYAKLRARATDVGPWETIRW